MKYRRLLAFVLAALILSSCSGARKRIVVEPIHIRVDLKAGGESDRKPIIEIDTNKDPELLFDLGYQAYIDNRRNWALAYFTAVVERHPDSPQYPDSAYNAGLILHKQGEYERAAAMYEMAVESVWNSQDRLDARFRILACFHELERWDETLALINAMREGGSVREDDDKIELMVREAAAAYHKDGIEKAAPLFAAALQEYEIGLRRGDVVNEYPGAMAAFHLGKIERERFDAVRLTVGDKKEMEARMEEKAERLMKAQSFFLRSIQQDNAYWATASGFQIGRIYRAFYSDIQKSPLPEGIGEGSEEAEMYRCMLSEKVRVLLKKSMQIYDRTLAMGERLRVKNNWTRKTRDDLAEVKRLYLEDMKKCEKVLPEEEVTMPPEPPESR